MNFHSVRGNSLLCQFFLSAENYLRIFGSDPPFLLYFEECCSVTNLFKMIRELWNNLPAAKAGSDQLAWPAAITSAWEHSPLAKTDPSEDDNLDTGNGSPEVPAFPPFVESLEAMISFGDNHRRYVQPLEHAEERRNLAESVSSGLQFLQMPFNPEKDAHACLGYSATHVWEACCRVMVSHTNDVVVVPVPTYTLLVPNILMTTGKVHYLDIGPSGKIPAALLAERVTAEDEQLLREWSDSLSHALPLVVGRIEKVVGRKLRLDATRDARVISSAVLDSGVPKNRLDTKISMMLLALLELDENEAKKVIESKVLAAFLPPQVRGLLFLNPTLGGKFYTKAETAELAKAVQQLQLTVVEDLAYTLMAESSFLASMGRIGAEDCAAQSCITLLGLSKPLGIANHRLGVAIGRNKQLIDSVDMFVRSSVGQVSTIYYAAVSSAFRSRSALSLYLKDAVEHPDYGYRRKLRIALAAINGARAGSAVQTELTKLLPSSAKDVSAPLVQRFLTSGLSEWVKPVAEPEGGIFILADMTAAIRQLQDLGYKRVNNTYELSILLTFCIHLRFLPEELIVSWTTDASALNGRMARLSFSCPSSRFVGLAFELFRLLSPPDKEASLPPKASVTPNFSAPHRELTIVEQSMFVEQMSRASAYSVVAPTRISGTLSCVHLQQAIASIVAAMPSLSFTYPLDSSGKPVCVASAPPPPLFVADYSDNAVRHFVEQPLDITSGRPLTVFGLFRQAHDEHVLVLLQHHIVTDNTTMFRILDELFHAYGGLRGTSPPLTISPVSSELLSLPWENEADIQWHVERLRNLPVPFEFPKGTGTTRDFVFDVTSEQVKLLLQVTAGRGTDFEVIMGLVAMALSATFPSVNLFGILMPASIRLSREAQLVSGFAINSLVCAIAVDPHTPLTRVIDLAAEAVRGCRLHISSPLPSVARRLRQEKKQVRLGDVALTVRPAAMDTARPVTAEGLSSAWQQTYLPQIRLDGTLQNTAKHPLAVCFTKKSNARDSGYTCEITTSSEFPAEAAVAFPDKLHLLFKLLSADVCAARLTSEAVPTPLSELSASVGSMVLGLITSLDLKARAFVSSHPALQLSGAELLHRALRVAAVIQMNRWHVVGAMLNKRTGCLLTTVVMLGATIIGATYVPIVADDDEAAALRLAASSTKLSGFFLDEWGRVGDEIPYCRVGSDGLPQHTASLPDLKEKWRVDDDGAAVVFPVRKSGPEPRTLSHKVLQHHLATWMSTVGAGKVDSQRALISHSALESPHHLFLVITAIAKNGTIIAVQDEALAGVAGSIAVVSSAARFVPRAKILVASGEGREVPAAVPSETERIYLCPAPSISVALFLFRHQAKPNRRILGTRLHHDDAIILNPDGVVAGTGVVGHLYLSTAVSFSGMNMMKRSVGTNTYVDVGIFCQHEDDLFLEPLTSVLAIPRDSLLGTELKVANLFAEILGISATTISRGTDFFDVGGNSFTVTQLAARVQSLRSADKAVSMAELINLVMRDLTVRGVASLIAEGPSTTAPTDAESPKPASPKLSSAEIDWENEIF